MKPIVTQTEENAYRIAIPYKKEAPLYVFDIGYHKTPPRHRYGPAVRPYFLLHLIKSGKGGIRRNGELTPLSAGEMFLIYPDETTIYYSDEENPLEYCWISFYGEYAERLVKETTPFLHSTYQKSGYIALKTACEKNICDTVGILNVLFEALNAIKAVEDKTADSDAVSIALRYIEENYFHPLDVAELASQLHYSRAYFSTLFRKATGDSPYQYLNDIRIAHAKEFLTHTQKPIEEIAFSVGFSSIERFSAFFKKKEGCSPLAYRKKSKR